MLTKPIRPKTLIVIAVTAIITSSIGFLILTSNESLFTSPPLEDEIKREQTSSSSSMNGNGQGQNKEDYYLRGSTTLNNTAYEEGKQLPVKNERYLCGTPFASSTEYIQEYYIPLTCSQPVGITVDSSNRIWFVATWSGNLVVFDPELQQFVDFIEIPNWKTKGTFGSMVWSMEFDKEGNLWFTDQVNDAIWRYS